MKGKERKNKNSVIHSDYNENRVFHNNNDTRNQRKKGTNNE